MPNRVMLALRASDIPINPRLTRGAGLLVFNEDNMYDRLY